MRIDTSEYRQAHGKQPRGQGIWNFMIGRAGAWTDHSERGTYSEAKRAVIRLAKQLDADTITLQG